MNAMYAWHRHHYPQMEPQDVVKLYFQAMLGCGHLLADEAQVVRRIQQEEAQLTPCKDEPLLEPLGPDYVRLNLRRAMADGITPQQIAAMMLASSATSHTRADVVQAVAALQDAQATKIAHRLVDEPAWLPGHSQRYRQLYVPAYRVISRACAAQL